MKLRTSYFNATVLRKDITRFAPVWGLYTVFTLMVLFLLWSNDSTPARFANNASDIMQAMGTVNFFYAGLCAVLLFGDLFTTRMCNALHAFPLRREGWFLTHCVAGFLFCLVPNTLAALLCALLLQQYFWMAFVWLGLMVLQFLFFFGVGVFAAVSAGNRLGSIAIYGIINFLAVILAWLVMTFYEPFLYGIELDMEQFVWFSPIVQFASSKYVMTDYPKIPTKLIFKGFVPIDWWFVCIAAAFGAVFLLLAVQIYRKRKLENAGDFISLHPMRPVFLITYTLCVGAAMYFISDVIAESAKYVFLIIGFAIGFFTGKMLLERKVNVFKGKSILAFGALLAAFAISIGLTWLDPVGVTRYVPQTQDVAQVQISPYRSRYYWTNHEYVLTELSDIEAIIDIHEDLVENRSISGDATLRISYELRNGITVERTYYLDSQSEEAKALKRYYSAWEYVLGTEDLEALLENAYTLEFRSEHADIPFVAVSTGSMMNPDDFKEKYEYLENGCVTYLVEDLSEDGHKAKGLNVALVKGLMEAIKADCDAGNMAQLWEYHQDRGICGWLSIEYFESQDDNSLNSYDRMGTLDIKIYEDCTNTIEYLKSITKQ